MRVVEIVSSVSQEASGPTYSVTRLCDSLRQIGEAVTLLTLAGGGTTGLPTYAESFPMGIGPKRLGHSPAMHRWLAQKATGDAIDIIHAHGLWMMTNVYPGWVAKRWKLPLVVSPRGTFTEYAMAAGSNVKRLFWPLIQRPALAPTLCFHATAEAEYLDIRRLGFRQPVAVIPNGIDLPELAPREVRDRRTLLFLARIHPNKGLDLLLPAWSQIENRFPDWDLRIVGSDQGYHGVSGHLKEMKTLAEQLQLKRVTFEGALYGNEKIKCFREADLYVLPTYSENFGMTVAEALAQETPVIVTQGAPWQGLESNDAGWWIEIGLSPLVLALESAMTEPRLRLEQMGSHGRKWMQRSFMWDGIAREMAETYRWLHDPTSSQPACILLN